MLSDKDIDSMKTLYFPFDLPVPYFFEENKFIEIFPISMKDSLMFLSCKEILTIDKNSSTDVEIIQMPYLDYIVKILFKEDELNSYRLRFLLENCLHIKLPQFGFNEKGHAFLYDEERDLIITHKQFDDIKKIILYQNIIDYDDTYINPELKESIEESKKLKSSNIEVPNIERKMAIITAHCGISKQEQMEMTYRTHEMLFNEVSEEVDFYTTRNAVLITGSSKDFDHWIYKKKKKWLDGYTSSVGSVAKSAGIQNVNM